MQYIDAGQIVRLSTNDLSGVTSGLHGANISATNLSGQYLLMKFDTTANQVVVASSATDPIIGVCMNAPVALDNAIIRLRNASGSFPAVAGGTIAAGDRLTSDSNGNVITTTTAGNEVVGIASVAAVSGDILEVISFTGVHA